MLHAAEKEKAALPLLPHRPLQRALLRERSQEHPKYAEMCRRFLSDSEDFSEEKIAAAGIGKRYENNDFDECLAELAAVIRKGLQ